ncbi:MAG TPA: RAMP superfamily CRISPR-associated protein [Verrucomicrobiae bacterium]|nr:RAMP superfamily CRISPR-associated protein [Verrucomicrobiae bacterium]
MNDPTRLPLRRIARVTIEFLTPFHIGAGCGGDGLDALVVTEVNGLPTIPGSSLAGVLRGAYRASTGPQSRRAEDLFGFQEEDKGSGSRLSVSWGCIHNSKNELVEGIQPPELLNDPVLVQALEPGHRDHVRIDHRGTAVRQAKFDERRVCAGHRFTCELELCDCDPAGADWQQILSLLSSGSLRLGGKSRRGYGAFKVVGILENTFDLRVPVQFAAYACHPARLAVRAAALQPWTSAHSATGDIATITLSKLRPCGYWMFGGGEDLHAEPVEMAALREDRIDWPDNQGRVERDLLVLSGSSLKGALAHRVAFHANGRAKMFANRIAAECANDLAGHRQATERFQAFVGESNLIVRELFGYAKTKGDAQRGLLIFDDLLIATHRVPGVSEKRIPHVAIDRFTGGAKDQALFEERPMRGGTLPDWKIVVTNAERVSVCARKALRAALDDLCGGALALGSGAGRGHGYWEGACACDPPDWFEQSPRP